MNPDLERNIRNWQKSSEGWSTIERLLEMAELTLMHRPKVVVQIGIFGGRDLVSIAMALKENKEGRIFGIDPWRVAPAIEGETHPANREWWSDTNKVDLNKMYEYCVAALAKYDLNDYATLIRSCSQDVHQLFGGVGIDFLLIDGNHSEVASHRDAVNYVQYVKRGGMIWCDDCGWCDAHGKPTTMKMQGFIERNCSTMKTATDGNGLYKLYKKN